MSEQTNKTVKIPFQITVKELADRLGLGIADVIKKLMENGITATINETIDYETAFIISEELGIKVELDESTSGSKESMTFEKLQEILKQENQEKNKYPSRPPVVTILGHVDHGKTTLLDTLRKTRVTEEEFGGITQHISIYQVEKKGKLITFVDTPGHEAFQSMRQRGAMMADITILVVAADDGVKPQTKEVVEFLLKNKIPTVVAINKIDKPEANVNRVKQELAEVGLFVEGYGGDVPFNEISAKSDIGLDELLDTVLLVADINDFHANADRTALGIVLEAHKNPKKGPLATVLVKTGTLEVGQNVIVGGVVGKIRRLEDYAGHAIKSAGPSTPVTIIGLENVPQSNDILYIDETGTSRQRVKFINKLLKGKTASAGQLSSQQLIANIDETKRTKLPVVLKADVQGTLEAIIQILDTIKNDEVSLDIISQGVGDITESDIKTAQTSSAIVYGFNVMPTSVAGRIAQGSTTAVKTFNIIYELIEDIKNELSELLEPEINQFELGKLRTLAVFKSGKGQMVVGGKVISGKMIKGENLKIVRDDEEIGVGKLVQLQQNKEGVGEVKEGLECGITFEGKDKIETSDYLICFKEEKIKRKI